MNAPFPTPLMVGRLVLRVLTGRLKGAEHLLPPGKFIRIGHSFDHDIVLRDTSTKGLSLELHIGTDIATIRMIAGEAGLLGRPVAAAEEASLPAYVPLTLGSFAVAIGEADSDRWAEVERLSSMIAPVASDAVPAAPQAALAERLTTRLYPLRDFVAGDQNWPLYGLLAGGLLLLAIGGGPATRWISGQFNGIENDKTILSEQGFGALSVVEGAHGQGSVITGIVKDDAELSRLRALVASRIGSASIDVDTMQGMAAAATDMLRAQGIDADAKPMRGNSLLVTTEFLPADRQDELIKLIRHDLPGVTRVSFATQNSRGDRDLQYFFSGTAYGLATFVDGTPGYIVTADGTHWFTGSQVPTGHKIIAIGNGRASFEREGRIEELVFGVPPVPAEIAPTRTSISSETKERTQL